MPKILHDQWNITAHVMYSGGDYSNHDADDIKDE